MKTPARLHSFFAACAALLVCLGAAAPHASAAPYAAGLNTHGQLGDGTTLSRSTFTPVVTTGALAGKTVTALAASSTDSSQSHALALDSDGRVYAWGLNGNGQLGDGTTTSRTTPVAVVVSGALAGKRIVAVAAGGFHSLALDSEGRVYAWGRGSEGQLGDGTASQRPTPVAVSVSGVLAGKTIVAVAAGAHHSLALGNDGRVYAWGYNSYGQLGDGTGSTRIVPVAVNVSGVLAGKTLVAVTAGALHSLALDSDGRVHAWGLNNYGQLGDGTGNHRATPVAVVVSGVLGGKTLVAVATGAYHSLALGSDGRVYAWGRNIEGQLGDGTTTTRPAPVAVVVSGALAGKTLVAVAAGTQHSLALGSDGRVYAWGNNGGGQLGDGTTIQRNAPVAATDIGFLSAIAAGGYASYALKLPLGVSDPTSRAVTAATALLGGRVTSQGDSAITARGVVFAPTAVNASPALDGSGVVTVPVSGTVGTFQTVVSGLAPGTAYSFAAYATNAGATAYTSVATFTTPPAAAPYAAGYNAQGQLGDGTTTNRWTFTPVLTTGALAGKTVTALAGSSTDSSQSHALALDSDGRVYAWGLNNSRQLGDGTTTNRPTPVAVDVSGVLAGKTLVAVAAGGIHSLALDSDGRVYAWGHNGHGQLGDGTTIARPAPVAVVVSGVLAGKTIVAVAAGLYHSLALDSEGRVYAWGLNVYGQLGDGTTITRPAPVAMVPSGVLAGKTLVAVTAGALHSVALDSDGRVYAWGHNGNGQLGDGTIINRTTPVAVNVSGVLGGKTLVAVTANGFHTLALGSNGRVYAWGLNFYGQLGDGTTTARTTPVAVVVSGALAGKTLVAVAAGTHHSQALGSDGRVYAWGNNGGGQLGDGTTIQRNAPVVTTNFGLVGALAAGSYTSYALAVLPTPTVATPTFASVTATSAELGGQVTSEGGATITERGVVYAKTSDNANPQLGGADVTPVTTLGTTGVFTVPVSSLTAGTAYTFKAYATNSHGTSYSTAASFTTLALPPTVTGLSPDTGSTAGGTSVTITGTGFTGTTGVTFGGVAVVSFVVVNDTTITAVVAAGSSGSGSVEVTTPGGTSAANTLYTYNTPLFSDHFTGNSGAVPAGWTLLPFDTSPASTVEETGTLVTLADARGANGPKLIQSPAFGGVLDFDLTVDIASMTGFSDGMSTSEPEALIVLGSLNSYLLVVSFQKATQSFTVIAFGPTEGELALLGGPHLPSYAGGAVQIRLRGDADSFRLSSPMDNYDSGDILYSALGAAGFDSLTDLGSAPRVVIGAESAGGVADGTLASVAFDRVVLDGTAAPLVAPTLTGVAPATGSTAGGTSVTITGTDFTDATDVTFGGLAASFTVDNATTITATTPAHAAGAAGAVSVVVTTPGGSNGANTLYTYEASELLAVYDGTLLGTELADDAGAVDFGSVERATTGAVRLFTLRNIGAGTMTGITVTKGTTGQPGEFSLDVSDLATSLNPGDTTTFTVTLTPGALGPRGTLLEITRSAGDDTPFVVHLIGEGVPPPFAVVTDEFMMPAAGMTGGGRIYRPLTGVINQQGFITFRAQGQVGSGGITSANDSMLLSDSSGALQVVAREGDLVQTSPWQTLGGVFTHFVLTEGGQSVALDRISGAPTTSDYAYIASPDGANLEILSREGDAAPSVGVFKTHTAKPAVDTQSRLYFSGDLSGTGVTTKTDSGIYQESAGTMVEIAREGDDVSALTGDPAWLGGLGAMVAAAGDGVAFTATLQNNPADAKQKTDTARNAVVMAGNEAALAVIARKGDEVPGAAKMKTFTGVSRGGADSHAFLGLMTTGGGVTTANDQVLVAAQGGALHLVAREGVTVVSGVTLTKFADFYATSAGEVIFKANDVLCRWTLAGGIEELARTGAPAPGMGGATFGKLGALSVSEGGAAALVTPLSNGRTALWRALPGGALSLVAQTSDVIVVDGVPQTILGLAIHNTGAGTGGGGGGMGAAINDDGFVLATVSFGSGLHAARVFP